MTHNYEITAVVVAISAEWSGHASRMSGATCLLTWPKRLPDAVSAGASSTRATGVMGMPALSRCALAERNLLHKLRESSRCEIEGSGTESKKLQCASAKGGAMIGASDCLLMCF